MRTATLTIGTAVIIVALAVAALASGHNAAAPKLNGKVGPGFTIKLVRNGKSVKTLKAGSYKVAVRDATKKDNFHLTGPGVNKKTGVKFRGAVTWTLKLKAGKHTVRSDAHKKLRRTFMVTPAT